MDGRALQGEAGGGVLRLWLSRRLPHSDRVARCGLRRPLHDGGPLRLEGRRRAGQDERMRLGQVRYTISVVSAGSQALFFALTPSLFVAVTRALYIFLLLLGMSRPASADDAKPLSTPLLV